MLHKYGSRVLMTLLSLLLLASMSLTSAAPAFAQEGSGGSSGSGKGWDQDIISAPTKNNGDKQLFSDGLTFPGNEKTKTDDIIPQTDGNSVAQGILSTANQLEASEIDQPEQGRNAFLAAVLNNSYDKVGDPAEIDFMQFMIVHHVVAVYMANSCVHKAVHSELKTLCQGILTSQAQQITQQEFYLASKWGVYVPVNPLEQDEFILDELGKIKANSDQFDKTWLELMMPHHAQAVVTAETCQANAEHLDVKELCQAIVFIQSKQIGTMADMLKNWYGVDKTTDPMKLAQSIQDHSFSKQ